MVELLPVRSELTILKPLDRNGKGRFSVVSKRNTDSVLYCYLFIIALFFGLPLKTYFSLPLYMCAGIDQLSKRWQMVKATVRAEQGSQRSKKSSLGQSAW